MTTNRHNEPGPGEPRDAVPAGESAGRYESLSPRTLIFSGYSKTPANAITPFGSGVMAVEVEVDPYDMRIVDAACECLPALGRKFIVSMLIGTHIVEGLRETVVAIRERYHGITQRALIAALDDLFRNYQEFEKKRDTRAVGKRKEGE